MWWVGHTSSRVRVWLHPVVQEKQGWRMFHSLAAAFTPSPFSVRMAQPVWPTGGSAELRMSISAGFHRGSESNGLLLSRRVLQVPEAAGCVILCPHLCNSDLQLLGGGCGWGIAMFMEGPTGLRVVILSIKGVVFCNFLGLQLLRWRLRGTAGG